MWTENTIFRRDLEDVCKLEFIPWKVLNGKTILITGATGLIGYTVVSALLFYSLKNNAEIKVIAAVRDEERAKKIYSAQLLNGCGLEFISGSVESLPKLACPIDYIIHCASPTDSKYFVTNPVDAMRTIAIGTENMLTLAREKQAAGMVFLSSMEVYGEVSDRRSLSEGDLGYIDILSTRSSYPEGKRFAEALCHAYAEQYHVPVTIARLAQTFGPGVRRDDSRVFAYMARCAIEGQDIYLNTNGAKENMYLYTMDAVSAILLLLLNGERGTAYNVGNPATYCSVREMAQLVAEKIGKTRVSVFTNANKNEAGIYPPESFLRLDTKKLEGLGWRANVGLLDMYARMIACFF